MSNSDPLRLLDRENDVLYRKVHPDFWDKAANKPKPEAFQDPGKNFKGLSFFVKRFKTPGEVFEFFAATSEVKNIVGKGIRPIYPTDMFDHGFRIAEIPASVLNEIEIAIGAKLTIDGPTPHEIDGKGHVSIREGQKFAILFLRKARLMDKDETCASI